MAVQDEYEDRGDIFEDDELEEGLEDESEEDESGEDDDSDDRGADEESEDDADDEEDEEPPVPEAKKEPRIPKSRLDEVSAQRDEFKDRALWLEEQLEKLISQGTKSDKVDSKVELPKEVYDFDTAEESYANLLISGEVGAASKLRAEINKARQAEMMEMVSTLTEKATSKVKTEQSMEKEAERFEIAISAVERKYSFLNTTSKDYNEEAVETVNTLLAGYLASGKMSKADALELAVKKAVPLYDKPEKEKLGSNTRVKDAGKKAADAASRQPTKVKTTATKNIDLQAVNVSKLSEKAFNELTDKERRILRGD